MSGPQPDPKLMAMERACARKWLEANGVQSNLLFEEAVEALALHIFHYLNGWQEES